MEKMRVGVIGCGMVCKSYLNTFKKFEHLEMGACADLIPERAAAVKEEYGFARSCTVEELLAGDDTDLVLNLTIPAAHCEVNLAILESGKHVFSEKPLGIKLHEARQVLDKAQEKELRVGCAPDTFLAGGHQHARQLIESGRIGKLLSAFGAVSGRGPDGYHANPHFFYEDGAGPMLDQGVYVITALLPLFGRVKTVSARAQIGVTERTVLTEQRFGEKIEIKTPTHLVCALEYEGGGLADLLISWEIRATKLPSLEVYGLDGTIRLPHWNNYQQDFDVYTHTDDGGGWENIETERPYVGGSHRGLGMAEMAAAILAGKPHRASGERANHVLDIMEGLVRSAREDKPIEMTTPYSKPDILAEGIQEGQIDHLC